MRRRWARVGRDVYGIGGKVATDIYICAKILSALERADTDVTGVPVDASLIAAADWLMMCKEAGGEDKLIETLGVADARTSN